jgi:hypothetical protein
MFVEYDTQRGMMIWCESEEEVDVESVGRSVRSHELSDGLESDARVREGSITKEVVHETVSRL